MRVTTASAKVATTSNTVINNNSSSSTTVPIPTTGKFFIYQNSSLGIKIEYPSDWKKVEDTSGVEFFTPSDIYHEIFGIVVTSLPTNHLSLDEYGNRTLAYVIQSNKGANLIELNATNLIAGNVPTNQALISYKLYNLKSLQIYTIKNDKAYIITYIIDSHNYAIYLPTIQKMIRSIQFIT